jgi:hypothetical protein
MDRIVNLAQHSDLRLRSELETVGRGVLLPEFGQV